MTCAAHDALAEEGCGDIPGMVRDNRPPTPGAASRLLEPEASILPVQDIEE
jgi:hypothetical protein